MNNTKSLQELFNNRIFRVPNYQRGYAWEQQQVREFLDDLELLSPDRRHYTGTIVLHQPQPPEPIKEKSDNEGNSYVEWHIVDGQQRFTTIVLLLNEISRALTDYENSRVLAQGIRKNYVAATDLDGLLFHKLSLNKDTDDFFKKSILPEPPSIAGPQVESARRLLNAKKQIAEHLCAEKVSEQSLQELYQKVTTRLHFNLYEVEKEAEVGVIFEVMNSRGKPLTELEKVKNYLLYVASSFDVEEDNREKFANSVNEAWANILERLMAAELGSPADENQMLRTHWLMQYDPQPKNWEGHGSIRSKFDLRKYQENHAKLLIELHEYVNGLSEACICFCNALKPTRSNAFDKFNGDIRHDVILWNEKFVRIEVTATFLPLLMAAQTRWPSEPKKYLEIVKLCELFAFRIYRVAEFRSNYRQAALFKIAYEVTHGMEFDDVMRRVKKEMMDPRANSRFDDFTHIEKPDHWFWWRGLRYFLYEYEQHLASARGVSPKVSWEEIGSGESIEHVLPQNITNRPYWQQYFDADTHKKYVHDIGNLVLTKDNSSLSNKSFPDKKGTIDANRPCYATSSLFQERKLARQEDWTPEAIDRRRARLLAWTQERWHVDFSGIYPAELDESDYDDDNREEE